MFYLKGKTKLIGAGVRDSSGKSVSRETPQAKAEKAPGPPAESEPYVPINVKLYKL